MNYDFPKIVVFQKCLACKYVFGWYNLSIIENTTDTI